MSVPQNQIIEQTLHANAETLIRDYSSEFTDALILQSKTLAKFEGTDEVQSVHVQRAKAIILTLSQKTNDRKALYFGLACVFLGIAFQGLAAEYFSATPRIGVSLIYAVIGIVSAFIISQIYKISSN